MRYVGRGRMAKLFASVVAVAGIGGAVVMFTLKTTPHHASYGYIGLSSGTPKVHPAWATAAGFGFLLGGLVLAAVVYALLAGREQQQPQTP